MVCRMNRSRYYLISASVGSKDRVSSSDWSRRRQCFSRDKLHKEAECLPTQAQQWRRVSLPCEGWGTAICSYYSFYFLFLVWSVQWVVGCWHGYLSGPRCRQAYGPADAPATHCLLLQQNPDWFYLSGTGSPGQSQKRAVKGVCVCVVWSVVMASAAEYLWMWSFQVLSLWLCFGPAICIFFCTLML